jgi:hypothetical protein
MGFQFFRGVLRLRVTFFSNSRPLVPESRKSVKRMLMENASAQGAISM